MPVNGAKNRIDNPEHQARLRFNRIERYAGRLVNEVKIADVHKFRTNSRRIEAIVNGFGAETRNNRKLIKLLSKLRKKAGKLRDLDVQLAFLNELKMPDHGDHRARMIELLSDARARRAKKLQKLFDSDTVIDLRKRLRRARADLNVNGADPLKVAYQHLPHPGHAITEKVLHLCRIEAKCARYLAELADTPAAQSFVEILKHAQDQVGEWHDVLKLREVAERRFGSAHDSPLVAALQNISRARFRRAVNSLLAALSELESHRAMTQPRKPHKAAASESPQREVAA